MTMEELFMSGRKSLFLGRCESAAEFYLYDLNIRYCSFIVLVTFLS